MHDLEPDPERRYSSIRMTSAKAVASHPRRAAFLPDAASCSPYPKKITA
jgi:hypothetical protein